MSCLVSGVGCSEMERTSFDITSLSDLHSISANANVNLITRCVVIVIKISQ